jgi:hypothetical protein
MNKLKAQELRIGNFLDRNGLMEVVGIVLGNVKVFDHYNKVPLKYFLEVDSFSGIPLSEEWLKKFGFEFERQTVGGFERWETIHGVHKAHIKLLDKKFSWAIGEYTQHILYVHQLQNLYFTLTGTELTVTESEPPNRE